MEVNQESFQVLHLRRRIAKLTLAYEDELLSSSALLHEAQEANHQLQLQVQALSEELSRSREVSEDTDSPD